MADTTTVGVNFVAQTQDALGSISSLERSLERLASAGRALGMIGAGILIGQRIGSALGSVVSAGETAEIQIARLTSAFTELSGRTGVPAAKLAMDEYQKAVQFAAETPFDVQGVVDGVVAMRSMGVDPLAMSFQNMSGQATNLMTILGNTVTSAQDFKEVLLAFRSASNGMMGVTLLARRLNMNVNDLKKGLDGLSPSTAAWRNQILQNIAVQPRFQNGMALTAKTLQGIRSNIEDMADQFVTAMADIQNSAGFYGKFKKIMEDFKNWLEQNGDKLKFFAKVVGLVLGQFLDIVWALLTPVRAIFQAVGNWMVSVQEKMTGAVNAMTDRVDAVGARMRALAIFSERLSLYISLVFGWLKVKIEDFYAAINKFLQFLGVDASDILLAFVAIIGSKLVWAIGKAILSSITLQGVLDALGKVGILLLVAQIISLIRGWDTLSTKEKIVRGLLIALTAIFVGLTFALKLATAAGIAFNITMLLNPVGLVILAIVALIAVIVVLVKYWDDIVAAVKRAWDAFAGFLDGLGTWGTSIKNGLLSIFDGVKEYFSGLWDIIAGIFTLDWNRIKGGFEKVLSGLTKIVDGIMDIFSGLGSKLFSLIGLGDLWNLIEECFRGIIQGIKDILGGLWDVVAGIFTGNWDRVLEGFGKIWEGIVGIFTSIWQFISGLAGMFWEGLTKLGEKLLGFVKGIWNHIKGTFSSLIDGIGSLASRLWDFISSPFRRVGETVGRAFSSIVSSISNTVDSIRQFGARVFEFIVSPFRRAYTAIRDALGRVWDFLFGENRQPAEIRVNGRVTTEGPTGPRRAAGGPVYAGKAYTVGENGPESFIPSMAGHIIPNGGTNVAQSLTLSVNVDARGATDPDAVGRAVADRLRTSLPDMVRNWSFSAT